MKKSLLVLLLLTGPLWADPPRLLIPAEVRPAGDYVRFTPDTDAVAVTYIGLSGVDSFPSEELKDGRRFLMNTRGLAAGRYRFSAVGASKTGEQTRTDFIVVVGDAPPPGPDPGPKPPDPKPPEPTPAPIPGDGLRVLFVYEAQVPLPKEQAAIVSGQTVRQRLNAACAKSASGFPEWRLYDKDANMAHDSVAWKAAMQRPRQSVPWVVISNPQKGGGYEGPLPKTVDEFMALLAKFGG